MIKDDKNPFVMEFHEQSYSLIFYGNLDKSLIMRIKKEINTISLNDFMSCSEDNAQGEEENNFEDNEDYTDQGSFSSSFPPTTTIYHNSPQFTTFFLAFTVF